MYTSYSVHGSLEPRKIHTRVRYNVTKLWSGKQHKCIFRYNTYACCLNIESTHLTTSVFNFYSFY